MPHGQNYAASMSVLVRGTAPPPDFLDRVRQRVHAVDTSVPVLDAGMLIRQTNLSFAMYDVAARVLRLVGLAAMALAALGIYGLVAYSVKQSTHEIGIRMAVGAGRAHIVRRYLATGLCLSGIGVILGLAGSVAGARVLTVLLYGVSPNDAFSFAAATITVVAAAGLAALIPAWHAACVDPLVALRRH
jgi:ABC-type antimicrobial peptide transport system permease subunit